MPIELLVVEDHPEVARAIVRHVGAQADMHVLTACATGEDALDWIKARNAGAVDIDLVLVDLSLPKMSGMDLISHLRDDYPHTRYLAVSAHDDHEYVRQALNGGAHGYVVKEDFLELVPAIRSVMNGERYLSKSLQ